MGHSTAASHFFLYLVRQYAGHDIGDAAGLNICLAELSGRCRQVFPAACYHQLVLLVVVEILCGKWLKFKLPDSPQI